MAMHARKEKTKAQALEPPLTGMAKAFEKARLKAERPEAHQFGPARINVPDLKSASLFSGVKQAAKKSAVQPAVAPDTSEMEVSRYQIQQAPYASVAAAAYPESEDQRTELDAWLAHACPRDYTMFVKTRGNHLDPDLDWIEAHGERLCAPQRLKRVQLIVTDKYGKKYPTYEYRREKTMTPDQWVERPPVVLRSWDKMSRKRAKKLYEKREQESREARAKLGKDYIEPPTVLNVLVRRPPGMELPLKRIRDRFVSRAAEWFVDHPEGTGAIHTEPYPHGITDPRAELKNKHQRARGAEVLNNRMVKHREPVLDQKEVLDAYATDLKARESGYTSQQSEVQSVSTRGVDTGMEYCYPEREMHTPEGVRIKNYATFKPPKIKRGERKLGLPLRKPVSYSDLQVERRTYEGWYTGEVLAEKACTPGEEVLAKEVFNLPAANDPDVKAEAPTFDITVALSEQLMEDIKKFRTAMKNAGPDGVRVIPLEGEHTVAIQVPAVNMVIPKDHPGAVEVFHDLALNAAKQARFFRRQKMEAKILTGGLNAWLDDDEFDRPIEGLNLEGLLDDGSVKMEIKRVPERERMMRPEDSLHNQCEYARYKAELYETQRAQENLKAFFKKSKRVEGRRYRWSKNQEYAHYRKKGNALRRYSYHLLYDIRKIHQKFEMPKDDGMAEEYLNRNIEKKMSKHFWYKYIAKDHAASVSMMNTVHVHSQKMKAKKSKAALTKPSEVSSNGSEWPIETVLKTPNMTGTQPVITSGRVMILEDVIVPGAEPVRLRKRILMPTHIHTIKGGDYTTPMGELVKKHMTTFGALMPRMYFEPPDRVKAKATRTVEETGKVQKPTLAEYRDQGQRTDAVERVLKRHRMQSRRSQRRKRAA